MNMVRIMNNTDIAFTRLMVLYAKEISSVPVGAIESIVFDHCKITIWGVNKILLEKTDL
jgi:hypothetical protein